jgi:hypothetical protein
MEKFKDLIAALAALITAITTLLALLENYEVTSIFENLNLSIVYTIIGVALTIILYLEWDRLTDKFFKPISIWSLKNKGILVFVLWASLILSFINLFYTKLQSDRYLKLADSQIGTQYLGGFPENMKEISKLIAGAEESLYISADFPAYGHFSQPDKFKLYVNAITKVRKSGFKLVFRHYAKDLSIATANDDWKIYPDLTAIKKLKTFDKWADVQVFKGSSKAEFIQALFIADEKVLGSILAHKKAFTVEIKNDIEKVPPVFVWVVDNDRAIFSFSHGAATFLTNDKGLIAKLCLLAGCSNGKK